jgi:hypothetical protein
MELPDLEEVRELILLCKSADIARARFGDVEFEFLPPPPPEPPRLPPASTGVVRGSDEADEEDNLPPGYRALFPNGVPRRS